MVSSFSNFCGDARTNTQMDIQVELFQDSFYFLFFFVLFLFCCTLKSYIIIIYLKIHVEIQVNPVIILEVTRIYVLYIQVIQHNNEKLLERSVAMYRNKQVTVI